MAFKINHLRLIAPPEASYRGADGPTHTAVWECEADEAMPADLALQLSQELVGPALPSVNPDGTPVTELPNPGDRLFWTSDQRLVPDTYALGIAGVTEFLGDENLSGNRYYDAGARALDFRATLLEPGCNYKFGFRVTYRPPRQGANEQPLQLEQMLAGRAGIGPPQQIPLTGDESQERKIEQRFYRTAIDYGIPVDSGGVLGTAERMEMPNGEPFPEQEIDAVQDVLVIRRNVADESYARRLNRLFANTTNNAPFNTGITGEPEQSPYTVQYETTRSIGPYTRSNDTYYIAETRLLLFNSAAATRIRQLSYGSFYLKGGDRDDIDAITYMEDLDGNPIDRIKLTENGDLSPSAGSHHEQTYIKFQPTDYSDLEP